MADLVLPGSEDALLRNVRDVLKTWDTPTHMDVLTLARLRVQRVAELEAALQAEKDFAMRFDEAGEGFCNAI